MALCEGVGMPQIMQPALQARPGGRFMEGVRHGIDLPPVVVPSFKLGWGSSQAKDGLPKRKRKSMIRKFLLLAKPRNYHQTLKSCSYNLLILPGHLWGRKISDVGDRGAPGYRMEWQEFFRPRIIDTDWI
jgi:hypothetical protein